MRTKPRESREQEVPVGRLRLVLDEFLARVARKSHPEGSWTEGIWQPSAQERRSCCEAIHPSTANRQALESHCRTQGHVAALFGVALPDLKAAVKAERVGLAGASGTIGPEQDLSMFLRVFRRFSGRQLRQQVQKEWPIIKRLRDLGEDEDLGEDLEAAGRAAERLLMSIRVAQNMETGLKDLGSVFSGPKPQRPASPLGADLAGLDDPAEG